MKTKPCLKLYEVKISAIEADPDKEFEVFCESKTVVARTATDAAKRIRLAKRIDHVEFISGIELISTIDKV